MRVGERYVSVLDLAHRFLENLIILMISIGTRGSTGRRGLTDEFLRLSGERAE